MILKPGSILPGFFKDPLPITNSKMTESYSNQFIELSDYWLSITRRDYPIRGFGKWILHTGEPHRLYQILREELLAGALKDASSMKTRTEPGGRGCGLYPHSALHRPGEAAEVGGGAGGAGRCTQVPALPVGHL